MYYNLASFFVYLVLDLLDLRNYIFDLFDIIRFLSTYIDSYTQMVYQKKKEIEEVTCVVNRNKKKNGNHRIILN